MEHKRKFSEVAVTEENKNWDLMNNRVRKLYSSDTIRSNFGRDYTRILHSMAYRRLKHKTQVFFNIDNDHICTRMEHVAHVESVSYTISNELGLNTELTRAIATGHDLGHAPFGHQGETIIKELHKKYLNAAFWHEKNGLYFVDNIELLKDHEGLYKNLMLTYAVRDGVLSHCGEVDENGIIPRDNYGDLYKIPKGSQPATWEGCVVKIADKIAYVGRDIEDATVLGFLDINAREQLKKIIGNDANTSFIMHSLIGDICTNSDVELGIRLSDEKNKMLKNIKDFNYQYIYQHPRLEPYRAYAKLVINQIFEFLLKGYDTSKNSINFNYFADNCRFFPKNCKNFCEWIYRYSDIGYNNEVKCLENFNKEIYRNDKIYKKMDKLEHYIRAILDYISGMTDRFAIESFEELLKYY